MTDYDVRGLGGLFSIVVMGVSGCGKSSVGEALARQMGRTFLEGDLLHPPANIKKMASGIPLEDGDRWDWLDAVGVRIRKAPAPLVLSCSALRHAYRDRLRVRAGQDLVFAHLTASPTLIARRMEARPGHFMPPSLLESQFAALEQLKADELSIEINADAPVDTITDEIVAGYKRAVWHFLTGAPS